MDEYEPGPPERTLRVGRVRVGRRDGSGDTLRVWSPDLASVSPAPVAVDGVVEVDIEVTQLQPQPLRLHLAWPIGPAITVWRPDSTSHRNIPGDWGTRNPVTSTRSAPVAALVGADDRNVLTVSLSTSVRICDFTLAVNEESAQAVFNAQVLDVAPQEGRLRLRCRIDTRPHHFASILGDVADGWHGEIPEPSAPVPEVAFAATYSTWYSDHQNITADRVERHASTAAGEGCRTIIVDDGWQTENKERGYAYCGDWDPVATTFPDMARHVARVHAIGLQYLLWIAPPLIGPQARSWPALNQFTLRTLPAMRAAVLDPRFPRVREHLIEKCLRPVREWGIDGLKIDFIDLWTQAGDAPRRPGMDCATVEEGAEQILKSVAEGCQAETGRLLVEFRQDYVGPRLRPFGTILRAADCPLDLVENRVRTIDLRLLARDRAVHSDMLLWDPRADPADVAAQFIATLYATPQVSMDFDRLPGSHRQVVAHWLGFMRDHADTLLHGQLLPSRPEARYSQVVARSDTETIITAYSDPYVRLPEPSPRRVVVVNGTGRAGLIFTGHDQQPYQVSLADCSGVELSAAGTAPAPGPWLVPVPPNGTATLVAVDRER